MKRFTESFNLSRRRFHPPVQYDQHMKGSIGLRIIKYALNLLGLTWMLYLTVFSYELIAYIPDCSYVGDVIASNINRLLPFYLLLLLILTGINFLIERKVEKRTGTREYFYLFIFQCIALILTAFLVSRNFRSSCIWHKKPHTSDVLNSENPSIRKQPAKTIIDFLHWYRTDQTINTFELVDNTDNTPFDSTRFYAVNFTETEKYLGALKATGFVSEKYRNHWRAHFKTCAQILRENPANDGPPEGFEYDFIMLSQDYEDDLKDLDQAKVLIQFVFEKRAYIKIRFPHGNILTYELVRAGNRWEIDRIFR